MIPITDTLSREWDARWFGWRSHCRDYQLQRRNGRTHYRVLVAADDSTARCTTCTRRCDHARILLALRRPTRNREG